MDTPIVWNYDADASGDGGSNVVAQVSGSVSAAVTNTPSVTVPGGVAINGNVGVTGNVGIVGSVAVAGSVTVAGNVNVAGGIINSKTQQASTVLCSGSYTLPTYYGGVNHLFRSDVTQYQTLVIRIADNNNTSNTGPNGGLILSLQWRDTNGDLLSEETAGYNFAGGMEWFVQVKGPILDIYTYGDRFVPSGLGANIRVTALTILVPERYQSLINPNNRARNSTGWGTVESMYQAKYGRQISVRDQISGSNGYAIVMLDSFAGRARLGAYLTGYAYGVNVRFYAWDKPFDQIEPQFYNNNLNQHTTWDVVCPRMPMFVEYTMQSGQTYGLYAYEMSWDNS